MKSFLILRGIIFFFLFVSNALASTQLIEKIRKLDIKTSLSLNHYLGFKDTYEQSSEFSLGFGWKLNDLNSFNMAQGVSKSYLIDPGESEVLFSDTVISHSYRVYRGSRGAFHLGTSMTLPLSQTSRDNGHYTKLSQGLSWSRVFLKKKLSLSYRPYYQYYFNQFKQGLNRRLLKHYGLGHGLSISYEWSQNWSLSSSVGHGVSYSEKSSFQKEPLLSDGFYSFQLGLDYSWSSKTSLGLSYIKSDSQINNTRQELYLFDEDNSVISVGLSHRL